MGRDGWTVLDTPAAGATTKEDDSFTLLQLALRDLHASDALGRATQLRITRYLERVRKEATDPGRTPIPTRKP